MLWVLVFVFSNAGRVLESMTHRRNRWSKTKVYLELLTRQRSANKGLKAEENRQKSKKGRRYNRIRRRKQSYRASLWLMLHSRHARLDVEIWEIPMFTSSRQLFNQKVAGMNFFFFFKVHSIYFTKSICNNDFDVDMKATHKSENL